MKCKDCNWCSQRASYKYFFCDKDKQPIDADDYYKGRKMDCSETQIEEGRFMENYIVWSIARK